MKLNYWKIFDHVIRMSAFMFLVYLAMPQYSSRQIYSIGIILFIFFNQLSEINDKIK